MGRRTIAAAIVVTALATPTAALAGPPLEEGATFFEDGSCQEQDGTPGQAAADGDCVTIADYDAMYSYANLAETPSTINPSVSIAEEAGLDPTDDTPPSERDLGSGVSEPHRFVDYFAPKGTVIAYVNGLPIRLA